MYVCNIFSIVNVTYFEINININCFLFTYIFKLQHGDVYNSVGHAVTQEVSELFACADSHARVAVA